MKTKMTEKIEKKHNPKFIRQDAYNIKSLKIAWRRPRGMHSKVRMSILGHRPRVKVGYRNAALIRNTRNSFPVIHVSNSKELEAAPQEAAIILAANLGMKKKEAIISRALEKHLNILNLNPGRFLEKLKKKAQKQAAPSTKDSTKAVQEEKKEKASTSPLHPQLSEEEAAKKLATEKRKLLEKPK